MIICNRSLGATSNLDVASVPPSARLRKTPKLVSPKDASNRVQLAPRLASQDGSKPRLILAAVASASSHAESAPTERAASTASGPSPFLEIGVDETLLDGLASSGVSRPSPIQVAAVPAILSGANCAVQSYTGSGKTLSYMLPALTLALRRAEALAADPATPKRGGFPDVPVQALVVAPSQELAMQIVRVAKGLLPPDLRYAVQQVIGGANPKRQAEALAAVPGPLVVVGTPGRLAEMTRISTLRLHPCPLMILDEADQLLAPTFAEDVNYLANHCGKRTILPKQEMQQFHQQQQQLQQQDSSQGGEQQPAQQPAHARSPPRQTVLVSATLTPTLLSKAERWCPAPRYVTAGAAPSAAPVDAFDVLRQGGGAAAGTAESPAWGWGARGWDGPASPLAARTHGTAGGVEGEGLVPTMPPQLQHYYVVTEPRHKVDMLRRAIHALGVSRALVFMNFQQRLKDAQFKLQARGMQVGALHGEMPRLARSTLLESFRRGKLRALMVSDVAARGIDVPACDAVFNLELPSSAAHYAHRAGRTGRLAAAMAASDSAAAGSAAKTEGTDSSASSAPARDPLEASVGTIVSIITPGERFVVDKLAGQLAVPLQEAHISHGELRVGPPPAGYSFEKDTDSDAKDPAQGSRPGEKPKRERKKGAAADEPAAAVSGKGAGKGAAAAAAAAGTVAAAAGAAAAAAAAGAGAGAAKKEKGNAAVSLPPGVKVAKGEAERYEIIVDDDDKIVLDDDEDGDGPDEEYEILDADLETFKSLRSSDVRALAEGRRVSLKAQRKERVVLPGTERRQQRQGAADSGSGAEPASRAQPQWRGPGGARGQAAAAEKARAPKGASRAEVMAELRKELEDLKAEKEARRKEGKKGGKDGGVSESKWSGV